MFVRGRQEDLDRRSGCAEEKVFALGEQAGGAEVDVSRIYGMRPACDST